MTQKAIRQAQQDCETHEQTCQSLGFHGDDYEECRLLGYKTHFVPHRRHIKSPLQIPAG
jgi:hypothetical protein